LAVRRAARLSAVAEIVWPLVFAFPIEWGRQLR
jgi:hypothetical protein